MLCCFELELRCWFSYLEPGLLLLHACGLPSCILGQISSLFTHTMANDLYSLSYSFCAAFNSEGVSWFVLRRPQQQGRSL